MPAEGTCTHEPGSAGRVVGGLLATHGPEPGVPCPHMGRLPGQGRPRAGVSLEELGYPPICGAAEHPSHQGTAPEPGPGLEGRRGPGRLRSSVCVWVWVWVGRVGPASPFPCA